MEKEIAIRDFRLMWNELAESGNKEKESVTAIDVKKYLNRCSLCQYVSELKEVPEICKDNIGSWATKEYCEMLCPVLWPRDNYGRAICFLGGGLFLEWVYASTIQDSKKLALQIANLPERKIEKGKNSTLIIKSALLLVSDGADKLIITFVGTSNFPNIMPIRDAQLDATIQKGHGEQWCIENLLIKPDIKFI